MRPKLDRYVSEATRQRFLAGVADWITIAGAVRACCDPQDDKLLETAINGEAHCIVSGDADLLTLDPFEGIRIRTPHDVLATGRGAARE